VLRANEIKSGVRWLFIQRELAFHTTDGAAGKFDLVLFCACLGVRFAPKPESFTSKARRFAEQLGVSAMTIQRAIKSAA
jgi:hypothetical protein